MLGGFISGSKKIVEFSRLELSLLESSQHKLSQLESKAYLSQV